MLNKILKFGELIVLGILLLACYSFQLAEANEYLGYVNFTINFTYICSVLMSALVLSTLLPTSIKSPSDFFVFLYGVFVLFPYTILFSIRGSINYFSFIGNFFILTFPLLCVLLAGKNTISISWPKLISERALTLIVLTCSIIGLGLAYLTAPESAGFDIINSYDRRLEARDGVETGSLAAYIISATTNGFAPFLAFRAALGKNFLLLLFSVFAGLAFYYFHGVKAPIIIICISYMLGYLARTDRIHVFAKAIRKLLAGVIVFSLVEDLIFGYSFVGDYLVRRALSVPPYVMSAFFEFMESSQSVAWSAFLGANAKEPITYIVGEQLLNSPGLNANTNAFLYQLASNGIPLYLLTILLVVGVYALINRVYAITRQPSMLYIGFLYAILLTEQAATTALLSSGVGLLLGLSLLSGKPASRQVASQSPLNT